MVGVFKRNLFKRSQFTCVYWLMGLGGMMINLLSAVKKRIRPAVTAVLHEAEGWLLADC